MSFLKIKDPKKRGAMVRDYLKTRANIKARNQAQATNDISSEQELAKIFRPVLESQQKHSESLIKAVDKLPRELAIEAAPRQHQLQNFDEDDFHSLPYDQSSHDFSQQDIQHYYGTIATKNLQKIYEMDSDHDATFGLRSDNGKFYIGNKAVDIDVDDVIVDGVRYEGTQGLWNLIMSKSPNEYNDGDLQNYAEILQKSSAMKRDNDPTTNHPKANKGPKWIKILKPIWKKSKKVKGSGTIFLPKDPNALVERLELLMASRQAGNTGVINELVSILDELLRQNHISRDQYKQISKRV